LKAELKLIDLKLKMDEINLRLVREGVYMQNPYQEAPIPIKHAVVKMKNMVWDATLGQITGIKGYRCEHYVDETFNEVKEAVKRFMDRTQR
jgi:folate-dependent tRNA-U54 methylase TrmFO/GidA